MKNHPKSEFVDLYIDGFYNGLYLLTEKKYDISVIEDNILKLYKDNLSTDTNYSYNIVKLLYKYIIFYLTYVIGDPIAIIKFTHKKPISNKALETI